MLLLIFQQLFCTTAPVQAERVSTISREQKIALAKTATEAIQLYFPGDKIFYRYDGDNYMLHIKKNLAGYDPNGNLQFLHQESAEASSLQYDISQLACVHPVSAELLTNTLVSVLSPIHYFNPHFIGLYILSEDEIIKIISEQNVKTNLPSTSPILHH